MVAWSLREPNPARGYIAVPALALKHDATVPRAADGEVSDVVAPVRLGGRSRRDPVAARVSELLANS